VQAGVAKGEPGGRVVLGDARRSAVPHDEPVAPVEWLRRLPDGEAIVLTGRHKPMRLRVPGWYEDPALREMVDPRVAAASTDSSR